MSCEFVLIWSSLCLTHFYSQSRSKLENKIVIGFLGEPLHLLGTFCFKLLKIFRCPKTNIKWKMQCTAILEHKKAEHAEWIRLAGCLECLLLNIKAKNTVYSIQITPLWSLPTKSLIMTVRWQKIFWLGLILKCMFLLRRAQGI